MNSTMNARNAGQTITQLTTNNMPFKFESSSKRVNHKMRVAEVMETIRVKSPNYMRGFLEMYPQYDNFTGINKVRAVVNLTIADEDIMNCLTEYSKTL